MLTTGQIAVRLTEIVGRYVPPWWVAKAVKAKGIPPTISAGKRIRLYGQEAIDQLAALLV